MRFASVVASHEKWLLVFSLRFEYNKPSAGFQQVPLKEKKIIMMNFGNLNLLNILSIVLRLGLDLGGLAAILYL